MADQATEQLTIAAPLQKVFETIVDFESYPEFFREIKETEVHEVDSEGRGTEVTFRTAAMGRSTRYRLRYDYAEAPERLTWELVDGDIMSQLDGFVKRRGEGLILKAALPELKARVEGL
jgi:uncharacterized protein YndB with AHSA1/START domain